MKKRRLPGWAKILLTAVLTLGVTLGGLCLLLGPSGLSMAETFLLARFAFVEADADLDAAADAALAAFVPALGDRWSYYLDRESYRTTNERRANSYVGVGITVIANQREEGLLIRSVASGGPADQVGIVPGDIITAVNGASIAGDAQTEGQKLIAGEAGTQVTLTLLREDGSTLEATCTRATLHTPSASGRMLEDEIGYVRLENFYSGAADSFRDATNALLEQGAKGLVIDLRSDPGGYIDELEEILDYLLPEGTVFTHKSRWWFEYRRQSDADCVDLPMAVLVDKDTYSAAELLAAQLRESLSAPIVGELTSGKGYSQVTFALPNGGGVGLSTATYRTGSGHSLIGEGITPDVELSLPEGALLGGEDDAPLAAAAGLLREK